MPVFKVTLKWGKQKFEGFEIDTDAGPAVLRQKIFETTAVPLEAQKIFPKKGKVLKDDADLNGFGLKDGSVVSLMGSATEQVATTKEASEQLLAKQNFVENMAQDELAKATQTWPTGLENLQNTCYLNACLQNLRNIPEVDLAMQTLEPGAVADPNNQQFVTALKGLFAQMNAGGDAVTPYMFVSLFRRMFPQYAQMQTVGQGQQAYMQHDADEAWGTLNRVIQQSVTGPEYEGGNLYDHLFCGEMTTELSCVENPDERREDKEPFWKMACYMDKEVTFVTAGIMKGLDGGVEMMSATLGVQANFSKTARISRLPRYLVVSFNRFDSKTIKQTGPGDSDKVVGLKILRPVTFPHVLDVYQLCHEQLRSVMDVGRRKLEDIKEAELAKKQASGTLLEQRAVDLSPSAKAAALEDLKKEKMGDKRDREDDQATAEDSAEPMELEGGAPGEEGAPGETNSSQAMEVDEELGPLGYYDLHGIITHKGRALSSGHYQGFVKNTQGGEEQWLRYDDDEIIPIRKEDVAKLNGGGDMDMAYLVVYKTRNQLP